MVAKTVACNHGFFFMMRFGIGAALMAILMRLYRQQGLLIARMTELSGSLEC